eukprot:scaffold85_cov358-Pavlova_lutheri.AAC.34
MRHVLTQQKGGMGHRRFHYVQCCSASRNIAIRPMNSRASITWMPCSNWNNEHHHFESSSARYFITRPLYLQQSLQRQDASHSLILQLQARVISHTSIASHRSLTILRNRRSNEYDDKM